MESGFAQSILAAYVVNRPLRIWSLPFLLTTSATDGPALVGDSVACNKMMGAHQALPWAVSTRRDKACCCGCVLSYRGLYVVATHERAGSP